MVNQNYPNFSEAKNMQNDAKKLTDLITENGCKPHLKGSETVRIPKISNTAKFQELVTKFNQRHYHNAFLVNQREIIRVIRLMEELF